MKLNLNIIDLEEQDKPESMPGFTKKEKRKLKLKQKFEKIRRMNSETNNINKN